MNLKKYLKSDQGLTLTEILIVLGILVILAVIAIGLSRSQIFKGNDARRKTDMHKISVAVEEYEEDHDCYPLPTLLVCDPGDGLEPYIDKLPCDPVTDSTYHYEYEDDSCPGWFRIYTDLENVNDEDATPGVGPYAAFNYYTESPNAPAVSQSTPAPTASGGAGGGGGGGGGNPQIYYGCRTGVCVSIAWDESRPGPECDPNYQNPTCYGQCGTPVTECTSWNQ